MNIRRGMFRLWIIATGLFVIGIGSVSYREIHKEFRNAYTDWDSEAAKLEGSSLLPVDCANARGKLGSDYSRNDDGLCWYETNKFRRLYPEYKDLSNSALSEKIYAKAGRPLKHFHPWVTLLQTAFIAFGIPLAILLLGYSLGWAFAGFRRSNSRI